MVAIAVAVNPRSRKVPGIQMRARKKTPTARQTNRRNHGSNGRINLPTDTSFSRAKARTFAGKLIRHAPVMVPSGAPMSPNALKNKNIATTVTNPSKKAVRQRRRS
jgi:hypothetical protein